MKSLKAYKIPKHCKAVYNSRLRIAGTGLYNAPLRSDLMTNCGLASLHELQHLLSAFLLLPQDNVARKHTDDLLEEVSLVFISQSNPFPADHQITQNPFSFIVAEEAVFLSSSIHKRLCFMKLCGRYKD